MALPMVAGVLLLAGGCEQTSTPVRREILGTWDGAGPPGVTVRMTVAETARAIDGAGFWIESGVAAAFRVFGALAREEVSLYFDFSEREDVTFQGRFVNADRMEGVFNGGGFQNTPIAFTRATPPD